MFLVLQVLHYGCFLDSLTTETKWVYKVSSAGQNYNTVQYNTMKYWEFEVYELTKLKEAPE